MSVAPLPDLEPYCDTCNGSGRYFDAFKGQVSCPACRRGRLAVNGSTSQAPPRSAPADHRPDDEESVPLLRRWSMAELLAEPDDFAWLVHGMLAEPTYGQLAGEMKSLKTYLAGMIQIGLAAGVPILGRFAPPEPRPVVAYVGEGGRRPYMRRLRRLAWAMGVNLADIPLYLITEVLPVDTDGFKLSLQRDLDELQPGLVFLDPLYAYHGIRTKASDLHQEGALLSSLSSRCVDAGASLMVVNHLNQTGVGLDLKRITMAGSGEWVDSWMLLAHREPGDVEAGDFKLRLEIGSRQWGGTRWDLDLHVGRFDPDTGSHDGDISWDLHPAAGPVIAARDATKEARKAEKKRLIIATLIDRPHTTKTDIRQIVGGNSQEFGQAFGELADAGFIVHTNPDPTPKTGGRTAPRWYATEVPFPTPGTEPDNNPTP